MVKIISLKSLGLVVSVIGATSCASQDQSPQARSSPNDLSHLVPIEGGGTWLRNGDCITIDEVHGTSELITVGNLYEIKGAYTLSSHSKASLAVEVTSDDLRHFPTMDTHSIMVDKGDGHFTVFLYMWTKGNPHISFYPANGGSSFASVYFGTGDSVLRHATWLDDPVCASTARPKTPASTQPDRVTRTYQVGIPTDIGVPVDDGAQ